MTLLIPSRSEGAALASKVLVPAHESRSRSRTLLTEDNRVRVNLTLPTKELVIEVPQEDQDWLYSTLHGLQRISKLSANWDSYGSAPITDDAIVGALCAIVGLLEHLNHELPPPAIVPTSRGGIQLEWHRGGGDIEINVTPERAFSAFTFNPRTEESVEFQSIGQADFRVIADLLAKLWA